MRANMSRSPTTALVLKGFPLHTCFSRRQKRIKMMERQIRCIWRNTPSPPPEERARLVAELELQNRPPSPKPTAPADLDPELEALAGAMVPAAGPEPEEEDEILADLNSREVTMFTAWLADQKTQAALALEARARQEEEDRVVGPEPPSSDYQVDADYGTHLRPGEGDAMAAYVQAGQRIPRRGEVGLTSDQISQYEEAGYVMSGSRHARMNAVRIRKENQVYTAEEKAALAMVNFEEKKKKEAAILDDMKRLVDRTLGPALPPAPADEEGDA